MVTAENTKVGDGGVSPILALKGLTTIGFVVLDSLQEEI